MSLTHPSLSVKHAETAAMRAKVETHGWARDLYQRPLLARVEATLAHGAHPEPHYRR